MTNNTNTVPARDPAAPKKPRRPSMSLRRFLAIQKVADKLRPQADARVGRGGLWSSDKETAQDVRTFIEWADSLKKWRAGR